VLLKIDEKMREKSNADLNAQIDVKIDALAVRIFMCACTQWGRKQGA
jgi:hypothetical protein